MAADLGRTGFYPNQPALDPAVVGSPYFGQLFDATLDGQIYAQPLYANGGRAGRSPPRTNHLYGLDAGDGRAPVDGGGVGTPFLASDLNCGDLTPSIGVTGTPAIDADSGTAYLLSKTYANGVSGAAAWYAHAIDLASGAERDGFPVAIAGAASNDAAHVFDPTQQHQRPGLLLMNGVVYAGFGAHCDEWPYAGWVVGISTRGFVQTMWTTESGAGNDSGGGIWQSGGGLVSDGDGQIIFATGNDWSSLPGPTAGHAPPGALGESIVRLSVQADGTLAATDFFSPTERDALNQGDTDLGSGAPAVALPASPGTAAHPNLLMPRPGGRRYFYLLDRDDLGGYQQAADRRRSASSAEARTLRRRVVEAQRVARRRRLRLRAHRQPLCNPSGCVEGVCLRSRWAPRPTARRCWSRVGTSSSTFAYGTERRRLLTVGRRNALGLGAAVDGLVVRAGRAWGASCAPTIPCRWTACCRCAISRTRGPRRSSRRPPWATDGSTSARARATSSASA